MLAREVMRERMVYVKLACGITAAVLVVFCWMFRYEVSPTVVGAASHLKLDRWTGSIYLCGGNGHCIDLSQAKAP